MLDGRVLWRGAPDDPRLPLLAHFGLRLQAMDDLAAADDNDVCVLPLAALAAGAWPRCGGLLLVDSAEQEAQWLAQAPPHFEVVREPAPALLLFERLARLLSATLGPARGATLDALTGCLGRSAWTRQLMQHLATPATEAVALVLLDLDRFRDFNDQHGHERGDQALVQVAALCRRQLGSHDVLGRWRDDAFAWLVQRYDADSVLRDVNELLAQLGRERLPTPASRWWPSGRAPTPLPSASAGLAWLDEEADFGRVLATADAALLQAQRQGGAQLVAAPARAPSTRRTAAPMDARTQLFNRSYFEARLAREGADCDRDAAPLALWLVDVQGLAALNAAGGPARGDAALAQLAAPLRSQARLVDWAARVSGSGFVVVMPRTDAEGAQAAHARWCQAVAPLALPLTQALVLREAREPAAALLARAWQARQPLSR